VLETISLGDEPPLSGVTGMRDYPRSRYSRRREVRDALVDVVTKARAGHILVSYNDEGLLSLDDLREILSLRGDPQAFTAPLGRFKADSARAYKRESTVEYLHYVRVIR
jgi:adenine-specific DNA-methyltransferase